MKELNEYEEQARALVGHWIDTMPLNVRTIIAIAEAFRAMEQRAEAAEAALAEVQRQKDSRWNPHDGECMPFGLNKDEMVYLRMKRQELRLPYPAGMVNWKHDGGDFDVIAWASVNAPLRPTTPIKLTELALDEDGKPKGFIEWYERYFALAPFKGTSHVADCESAWSTAILRNIEEQSQ